MRPRPLCWKHHELPVELKGSWHNYYFMFLWSNFSLIYIRIVRNYVVEMYAYLLFLLLLWFLCMPQSVDELIFVKYFKFIKILQSHSSCLDIWKLLFLTPCMCQKLKIMFISAYHRIKKFSYIWRKPMVYKPKWHLPPKNVEGEVMGSISIPCRFVGFVCPKKVNFGGKQCLYTSSIFFGDRLAYVGLLLFVQ